MFSRGAELRSQLAKVLKLLDVLDRRADKMETILMVREPSTVAAADAYEGLRKQVVNAVSERLTHVSQLVQLDSALAHGADVEQLQKLTDSWFEQAGVTRITDPRHPQRGTLFDLVSDGGGAFEIIEPAYIDSLTGRVIRLGRARRLAPAHAAPERPAPTAKAKAAADRAEPDADDAAEDLADERTEDEPDPSGERPKAADRAVNGSAVAAHATDEEADR
ncbi:hypothetical protein F4553_006608 [Allocatelliglobosispora scoriae]|uniref:Uncharacterized protein n=1 Tax=Allocatelliglobosispora scoriae TaxID=643052 RepID=A0A841BYE7_9ACTN|nr:hypothetical protein [Allocatelliglobosispora scoriae]MBB5873174.1 hypothetical protein [Allocatelliglobosispora scoriae]